MPHKACTNLLYEFIIAMIFLIHLIILFLLVYGTTLHRSTSMGAAGASKPSRALLSKGLAHIKLVSAAEADFLPQLLILPCMLVVLGVNLILST